MIPLQLISDAPPPTAGREYWRSLDEFAATPAFRELMEREFPAQAAEWHDPISRRRFLTLMGASFALAGLSGCNTKPPAETIVPAVHYPEPMTPGKPLFFATAMTHAGSGVGLLVESHAGRPTKIEGNPDHPASLGATDHFAQAAILDLYDPDRSQALTYLGRIRGWNDAIAELQKVMTKLKPDGGKGFRILSERVVSPTLVRQRDELLKTFPEARWCEYEPADAGNGRSGRTAAFGEPCDVHYRFKECRRLLTLDADLFAMPDGLRYAREVIDRRRDRTQDGMNRLYAVESYPTTFGLAAEHRLPVRPSEVETFVRELAEKFGILAVGEKPNNSNAAARSRFVNAVAADLKQHEGRCAVVPGETQPRAVHELAFAINDALKAIGKTVIVTQPLAPALDKPLALGDLVGEMRAGKIELLLILGGNPVFTAPSDLAFGEALEKVPLRVRLGRHDDETSRRCQWHIPETHFLESWGDTRAYNGTATVVQPLIAPLYAGRSVHEILAAFSDRPNRSSHEIVKESWRDYHKTAGVKEPFEVFWRKTLHKGVVDGTAFKPKVVALKGGNPKQVGETTAGLEVVFRTDPTLHDGAAANNGWLQELPKPITKLTWGNAAIVSPATAKTLGVTNGIGPHGGGHGETIADCVTLTLGPATLTDVPCLILPSHPDNCVTLHLGHGREVVGKVGREVGVNAYKLRRSSGLFSEGGVTVTKSGKKATLACTQHHHLMASQEAHTRGLVRGGTLTEFLKDPKHVAGGHHGHHDGPLPSVVGVPQKPPAVGKLPLDLYPAFPYDGYKWGMSVNLSACIGCTACVVACQAENNIPIVGKDQITRGREMHWMRIDQYYHGDPNSGDALDVQYEPVMCQQCENAPCEVVCPVEATAHGPDGLNEMAYNRCVGTRYCSNNCPYKVRRFNFFQYADYATESLKLQRNPEVTVRTRGVMEKCTYCVQRIRNAEIEAKNQKRSIRDGDVITACQAACPTQAIVFGDMNDKTSKVYAAKTNEITFGLLTELNTRPRTTYHAAVRNPNPVLARAEAHGGH